MLKLLHFLASLSPSSASATLRAGERVTVACDVQALIEYEHVASDSELWSRLRRDLAVWANSGVVPRGTVDQLYEASMSFDPRWEIAPSERTLGRQVLRSRLEALYCALIDDALPPAGGRSAPGDHRQRAR